MKRLAGVLSALSCLLPIASAASGLSVDRAYVPEPPPSVAVAAAYFTIRNDSDAPIVIVGAVDGVASGGASLSLHRSTTEGKIARMVAPVSARVRDRDGSPTHLHHHARHQGDM